jgi:hypothetical protein
MTLDGRFSDGIGSVQSNIPIDVMPIFLPIEILLKYCYYLPHTKVPYHPTIMVLLNYLCMLIGRKTKMA